MRVGQTGNQSQTGDIQKSKSVTRGDLEKTGKASLGAPLQPAADDATASISDRGKEFAKAKSIAADASDVREDRIAELKRRIASGNYNVDPSAVADRIVDDHIKMSGIG